MPSAGAEPARARGLRALRRGGAVSDLLFLYECAVREVAQLRSVAEALGLTVQAASHTFRGLSRRGLVELVNGRYRPTVAGVDFLHSTLGDVQTDLSLRLERLHIVRTTRAVARGAIRKGAGVVLGLEDGTLVARPGRVGPSRGVARTAARAGGLVEVERLEGIVPLHPVRVRVLIVPESSLEAGATVRAVTTELARFRRGLLAAHGLEVHHLVERAAPGRNVVRFGIAGAIEEASSLGVACTIVVLDRDVPELLTRFDASRPPAFDLVRLGRGRGSAPPRV